LKSFNPSAKREERALQAYLILIGAAHNRQTLTYKDLSLIMFGESRQAQGVLAGILGCIAFYCQDKRLPILTTIVVNETTGDPGYGIPLSNSPAQEREKVYATNWYHNVPPTTEELNKSYNDNA
jgi:hypothetical protein